MAPKAVFMEKVPRVKHIAPKLVEIFVSAGYIVRFFVDTLLCAPAG